MENDNVITKKEFIDLEMNKDTKKWHIITYCATYFVAFIHIVVSLVNLKTTGISMLLFAFLFAFLGVGIQFFKGDKYCALILPAFSILVLIISVYLKASAFPSVLSFLVGVGVVYTTLSLNSEYERFISVKYLNK